jgi:hypothetical protein
VHTSPPQASSAELEKIWQEAVKDVVVAEAQEEAQKVRRWTYQICC